MYILSFIIFICLEWFQLITQSIKYLTVNQVLVILMYIHKSCNNALLFLLIESRTQNVKTKTLSLRDINHRVEIVRRNVA